MIFFFSFDSLKSLEYPPESLHIYIFFFSLISAGNSTWSLSRLGTKEERKEDKFAEVGLILFYYWVMGGKKKRYERGGHCLCRLDRYL